MNADRFLQLMLRVVPIRWRESVRQDLQLERSSSSGSASLWRAWQALTIGLAFRRLEARDRLAGWKSPMRGACDDMRFAVRSVVRQPISSAAIVLTLALGIGATTAAYAIFNHVLFRPTPGVGDTARIISIQFEKSDNRRSMSSGSRAALQELRRSPSLERLGDGWETSVPAILASSGEPALTTIELVSDQYFDVLGVRAKLGRLFSDEEAASPAMVAVVSESLWRRAYGGRQDVLGQTIRLSNHAFTVIGVASGYRGWGATRVGAVDVWVPVGASQAATLRDDVEYLGKLVGRLRSGATAMQADAQLKAAYRA